MVLVRQPVWLYAAANESPALSGERGSQVRFGPEPETAACDLGWDHPHVVLLQRRGPPIDHCADVVAVTRVGMSRIESGAQ